MRSLSLGQALEDQTLQRSHQGLDGHQKHQSIQEERQEAHLEEAHQFVLAQLRKSAGPPFSRPVPLHCWLKHKRRLLGVDPKDLALKNHHLERVEVLQNSDVLHAEAAQAPAAKLLDLARSPSLVGLVHHAHHEVDFHGLLRRCKWESCRA